MATATRQMTSWLAQPERRLLCYLAERLPAGWRPNHLSGLGVFGAVGAGTAYALAGFDVRWLWGATAMLALNWFGDSLDGTLARVRRIERPKYGYYLDHLIDAFSTAVVGLGIGLSPYVRIEVALAVVVVYLMLSINVYLESSVFGVFTMAYGWIGPTEGRLILMAGNTGLVFLAAVGVGEPSAALGNVVVSGLGVGLLGLLTVRFGRNLHRLARLEPQQG